MMKMDETRLRELVAEFMAQRETKQDIQLHFPEHDVRMERASRILTREHIPDLTEDELKELALNSDAATFWKNKDYFLEKTIAGATIAEWRERMAQFLEMAESGIETPDALGGARQIALGGMLLTTELLAWRFPSTYWVFSEKPLLEAMEALGVDLKGQQPHGQKSDNHLYFAMRPHMDAVRDALADAGIADANYLDADIFFWWLRGNVAPPTRVWWINHRDTYESNRDGGFIWARKESADGRSVAHHRRLEEMREGDVTVHNPGGRIAAIGRVTAKAVDETLHGDEGAGPGWRVTVEYYEFAQPIELDTQMLTDLRALDIAGGPIGGDARINQGYAFNFSVEGLHILRRASNAEWPDWAEELIPIGAPTVRYWKVSPGVRGSHWDEFHTGHCIGIGGHEIGDLGALDPASADDLRAYYGNLETRTDASWSEPYATGQYWSVLREMSEGDRVIVYANRRILGTGAIAGEYYFEEGADAYPHRRRVVWDEGGALPVAQLPSDLRGRLQRRVTVAELSPEDYRTVMDALGSGTLPPAMEEPVRVIQSQLSAAGFHFSNWDVASFYTALQTKGFVILSGISGTGKTKLAQHFAAMLPGLRGIQREQGDALNITVLPHMLRYGRITMAKQVHSLLEWSDPGEKRRVPVRIGDVEDLCAASPYGQASRLVVYLRRQVKSEFERVFAEGDTVVVGIETDEDGVLKGLRLETEEEAATGTELDQPDATNHMFIPVRPDWRDSKSLLGYYNPLTQEYNWTDFLRFVMRAHRNYSSDKEPTIAWFVILDEMNLARVEYYFADLLSVLESGRDGGWTREPLRCEYPDDAAGELPPREIHLPPNLYVIGTVNVDETTHAFSPKVLDRAFTIRMTDVDFATYPPDCTGEAEPSTSAKQALLDGFTRGGRFAVIEKSAIGEFVADNPEVRDRLQELNRHLRLYDMHFGYRVFDEIVSFLEAAEQSGSFDDPDQALDGAVLMKVLPKLHGSRGKLEGPLVALHAWCINPDAPEPSSLEADIEGLGDDVDVIAMLAARDTIYQKTAQRVRQMLRDLYTDGFTAFG